MPAEARVTSIWKKQKLFVAAFLIAGGLWFFIDGEWTWPRSNERWKEHTRLEKENRLAEWPAIAKSRRWKIEPPEKYHDQGEITGQFVIANLLVVSGAIVLFYWLSQKRRTVRIDHEAVFTPAGTRVPFTAITGLGLKKWESKGFATVRYEINGRKGEFLLDDYKYDRDATHEILKEIEVHLLARTQPQ
ncbi:MAG TPA: hypothetical protein VEO95_07710 [Chthoniobacteraceae bacterium]|nr:hypothetical protein [Chthoniobacteraceae bacterium]